jgi:murein DD-endopeptidase MepM/ murein hydrolase activator NlpD
LLDSQAGRDVLNYFESSVVFVDVTPTPLDPIVIRTSPVWWENLRATQRYIYAATEWTPDLSEPWQEFMRSLFIINHDPITNAGPDQVITLDSAGTVLSDIVLDGSASSDPDSSYPDYAGPLNYSWTLESLPATADPNGVVGLAATNIPTVSQPLLIAAGTQVPARDYGMYELRLTVKDNEVATVGIRAGQSGEHSSTTRIFLQASPPTVSILYPTSNAPFIQNWDNQIDGRLSIPIYYSLGDVGNSAAYGGAWIVRLTIRQAIAYPYGSSPPVGTVVYEAEKVSPNPIDSFLWDGFIAEGDVYASNYKGWRALGAFTIELELLDRDGNPVARPGLPGDYYSIKETNALAIDYFRWGYPVVLDWESIRLTGAFMESGHGGPPGHIHAGIDIGRHRTIAGDQPTDVVAVATGFYQRVGAEGQGVNTMKLIHNVSETTVYLHCANRLDRSDNSMVLQGTKLGDMSNIGTTAPHLHFEYHSTERGFLEIKNPLGILFLRDDQYIGGEPYPKIIGVYLRRAEPANQPARMAALGTGIENFVDVIVHCRDKAHPDYVSTTGMYLGPYGVRLVNVNGFINAEMEFSSFVPLNNPQLTQYCTSESVNTPASAANHHQLYFRCPVPVGMFPNYRATGPVSFMVEVYDIVGHSTIQVISVGTDVRLLPVANNPPNPALTVAGGNTFQLTIEVIGRTHYVAGANDDFHIDLIGAPQGWTVSPTCTGVLPTGVPNNISLTIDSHGLKPAGTYNFQIVVYSDILSGVGTQVAINARVQ